MQIDYYLTEYSQMDIHTAMQEHKISGHIFKDLQKTRNNPQVSHY